jgi:hypothetical protein
MHITREAVIIFSDRQKMAGNQILQEWKSGLTDDVDNRVGPKTQEYTKRKG